MYPSGKPPAGLASLRHWQRWCKGSFKFNWRVLVHYGWYQNHMSRKGLYF